MQTKDDQQLSYTKLFLIKSVSELLSTSSPGHVVLKNEDADMLNHVSEMLVKTCQSGELLQISYALDAFYEIFSENYYDASLKANSVIELMAAGEPNLQTMFKAAKKQKSYSKHELGQIENSLVNIKPFVEYK